MDFVVIISAIAAIVTIAGGIATFVSRMQNDKPGQAKTTAIITALLLVVIVVAAFVFSQTLGHATTLGSAAQNSPASANAPTATVAALPTATATPRPLTPGAVICHSGANDNWSGWSLSGDWTLLNGLVLNDGSNQSSETLGLIPPPVCQPTTPDYIVQATIRVPNVDRGYAFGIVVRAISTTNGYTGYEGWADFYDATPPFFRLSTLENVVPPLTQAQYNIGTGWNTYAVEVKGNIVTFLINGARIGQVTDNTHLHPGEIGLWCQSMQLEMKDFKVTAA